MFSEKNISPEEFIKNILVHYQCDQLLIEKFSKAFLHYKLIHNKNLANTFNTNLNEAKSNANVSLLTLIQEVNIALNEKNLSGAERQKLTAAIEVLSSKVSTASPKLSK